MERNDPPFVGDEKTMLEAWLDYHRATLVQKVEGLTEEQVRQTPLPSGTSLRGLVTHLTDVEKWWFAACVAGRDVEFAWTDEDPDADWRAPEDVTIAELVAAYEAECARSREVLAGADLDTVVDIPERKPRSVRWVLVHMVEETARHNGHADVLRELVDGSVGD
jgi:uncharacterized damage-inducible protein DinB